MLKQNRSSGGRRSSDRTPDVTQVSCFPNGCASTAPQTGKNLVAAAVNVLGAWFSLKIERSKRDQETVRNFKSSSSAFSGSSHDSSHGIRSRSSSRRLYATGSNPSQRQPGNQKFTLQDISKATHNFSRSLKIGEGGFGTVYRGILDDGTLIAVKRAKKAEIKTLARVEHLNLVKFLGYVEEDGEKVVVLEYVPNGTLRSISIVYRESLLILLHVWILP